eukprot:CAMPEP_0198303952 /NCGR_PEP_ID=MMETSP1449-20131203/57151_1 /TAXON_ID=420275 /ORGANISM="Attheya septentrionalis, Strain CCMP2084" /LENGTH=218 /DNA_ID=CAMNT_0044006459 /DNA_START=104 /DNA_END=760 /DNA_ORIENTATION=-
MKYLTLLFVVAALCGCRAQEPEADDGVVVSAKCAAVILASTTTLGAGVAYTLTPAALCTAGFCAPGIAGSSFAAWWQSTIPLVVKGSLFAQLQAMAMGGIGVSSTVAGATVGGVLGATYLRDLCSFVDEADPESVMGRVFATSLTVVTTAIETKQKLQSKLKHEIDIKTQKGEFGARVSDYMRRKKLEFSSEIAELENIYNENMEKVRAQIMEKESQG